MNAKRLMITSVASLVLISWLSPARATVTVVGWGQNGSGQATNTAGPVTGVQAIAAGSDDSTSSVGFSLGLNFSGSILSWGAIPAPPTSTNSYFVAIAAGEYHAVGLTADGKVYAWGANLNHETNVPPILSSNVIAIAAGSSGPDANNGAGTHSLALKSDGTVVSWGRNIIGLNNVGQTNVPANLSNVVAIAAGATHSLALKADGTVVSWGGNLSSLTNVPASATNVVAIAAGNLVSMALKTNGAVIAWGNPNFSQTTVPTGASSNVVAIAAGDQHCMALRRDGTVVTWGSPSYAFSVPVGLTNVIAIASSGRHALTMVGDGTPGITVPPRNQSVYPGGKAVFIVMAAGAANLTYQWQANGINIPGATSSILVLTNVQPVNSGSYQVTVRSSVGVDSASAGLTLLDGRVSITQQPALTNSVDANSNLTVSVTAVGAIPLYFQWWKDGGIITGATNTSYTITNAQFANNGGYSVIVSNVYGAVMSSTDNVGVIYHAPVFVTQPIGTNVPVGGAFQLSAAVTGTSPFGWQWRTNGIPIAGATATNYIVNAAQLSDAGTYDVVVTNSSGNGVNTTNSSQAVVNVGYAPVVVLQPLSLTNNVGDTANFSCLVTGTPPINLQWTLNGYTMANQTNFSLTLTNVQSTNIGFYALVATNIFGSAVSSNAAMNVNGFNFSQWAGLEAYYPFTNGDVNDYSGNGNNGTNSGAVAAIDRFGNTNGAMSFNANGSNYIQCKTGAYFGSNYSVTAWVNVAAYGSWSRVLDFGNGPGSYNTLFAVSDGNLGKPSLVPYGNGVALLPNLDAPSAIPLNTWVAIVVTSDGLQECMYINGVKQATLAGGMNRPVNTTVNNYLGRSNWGPPDTYLSGILDDIRIFDRALSSNDVAQLYAMEADVPVITQQPQAQTVDAGSTVSFSVAAIANHPLTYQWRTNDVPIAGATNSVLSLINVQSANIGFYSVAVSNSVTGVVSFGALLNLTGAADPTTNGLIAYYPLNGNANDAGTNGLNGITNSSGTFWTTNRFGVANSALGLNGSTGFMSVSDPNALLNFDVRSNNYTITTWVMFNSLSSFQTILIDRGTTQNQHSSYTLGFDNGLGEFYTQMWDGGNFVTVHNSSAVSGGRWYQLAVVVANGTVNLFVNGVDGNGALVPANFGSTKNTEGIRDFGRWAGVSPANYLNGDIDDIRFYNRALSSDEVAYLYALESQSTIQPSPTLTANLGSGPDLNLIFTGSPGSNYVLQTATNLTPPIQWLPVLTNAAATNGVWQATDTNLNSPQKFYRVTTP